MNSQVTRLIGMYFLVSLSATASADERRFVDYGWRVTSEGAKRLAADLGVQGEGAGRTVFESLWKEYDESLEIRRSAWDEETKELRLSLIFELAGPELDEAFDISDLPAEEQDRIENMRAMFKRDRNPFVIDRRFLEPWQAHSKQLSRATNAYEQEKRDEFVTACMNLMTLEDREAIEARARHRLAINMHALLPAHTTPGIKGRTDPVWRVDILGLCSDATDPGAELEWASTVFVDPEAALAEHEGSLGQLARLMKEFEVEFAGLVEAYEKGVPEWQISHMRAFNNGRYGAARGLTNRDNSHRKQVLLRRRQFAEDVGEILREIDPELRSSWLSRYRLADCPKLFSDDSVDLVARTLLALTDLGEDERDAVGEVYRQYHIERDLLRARAYDLELQEYCDQRIGLKSEPESRWTARLRTVSQSRIALAEQTVGSLREVVGPSRSSMVDELAAAYRARVKRSVEVRP